MEKIGYVYMMTTVDNTAIYTGVTSDLVQRYAQHVNKEFPTSFTAKYHCSKLVYYRRFHDIDTAIKEEKRIKGGSRKAKMALITRLNPNWIDLGRFLFGF